MDLPTENDEDKAISNIKKRKTTRRNRNKIEYDGIGTLLEQRNIKGIILSITKPSHTLRKGIGRGLRTLRLEHRIRLRYLLRQLIRRQNWDEASGVLSVLLKGTYRENSLLAIRTKYWATLELLEHMGTAKLKPRKILQVYEIWMKKNFATMTKRQALKGSFDVQLEFLLFCLSQGDTDGAYQAVISLQQESGFASNPLANLVVGLAFSHLWYNAIQKEMLLHDSLESGSPIQSEISRPRHNMSIDHSNGHTIVKVEDSDTSFQRDTNTSIRIDKVIDRKEVDRHRAIAMEVDHDVKKEIVQCEELHMNSVETDQSDNPSHFPLTGNKRYGSIFYARDLEYMLMPLRFPNTNTFEDFISFQGRLQNDHYKAAVKHLRGALHSSPPAFEALLPLVQMLILGDHVKEAIEEVESAVQNSQATLPFRLKASILEHFSNEDSNKLCICFEDTLKKDPTCNNSLAKLISLHQNGFYSTEKLLEMIALHLDATYAGSHIWKEFASCFIKLSHCNEDAMSGCGHGDSYTKRSENVPKTCKDNVSRNSWRLRCRWWLTRHFTQSILASEAASGNMELLTYKAASACHLYGPEFTYVVKACTYLKNDNNQENLILKMHMKSDTLRIYAK